MRILGIDYGKKRIGLAISDPLGSFAMPLAVLENNGDIYIKIKGYCDQYDASKIILGLPKTLNNELSFSAREVDFFAKNVREKVGIDVEKWDERLTTKIAEKLMIESGVKRKARKLSVDKIAASVMLSDYLERHKISL